MSSPTFNHSMDLNKKFGAICGFELALGLIAILLGLALGLDPRSSIPKVYDVVEIGKQLSIGAVAGVLLAIAMVCVGAIPWKWIQSLGDSTAQQVVALLGGLSIPQLLIVALCAGVGEELLFRGFVMQSFTGDMKFASQPQLFSGLIWSSVVFALAHPISRVYVLFAFLMGLALGAVYWLCEGLLAPIAAHWIYDAIIMIWLVKYKR
jgi:uncharacterized protein